LERYKKGDVYVCAESMCGLEVTVTKPCVCEKCSPLSCCGKPMVKKK
jgi:hypothetical protein